jgi:hypothetical protein
MHDAATSIKVVSSNNQMHVGYTLNPSAQMNILWDIL